MENTKQNKERFFGIYISQKVLANTQGVKYPLVYLNKSWNWTHYGFYLELKPISKLTNEDAIEVSKICSFCDGEGFIVDLDESTIYVYDKYNENPYGQNTFKIFFNDFEIYSLDDEGNVFEYDWNRLIEVSDYLRSKGYALPWMGLSVEKQIDYGWIKLLQ